MHLEFPVQALYRTPCGARHIVMGDRAQREQFVRVQPPAGIVLKKRVAFPFIRATWKKIESRAILRRSVGVTTNLLVYELPNLRPALWLNVAA